MKIYTRTGDFGETSIFGGKKISKSSLQIEAYGSIDELNSFIGLAISEIGQINIRRFLKTLQTDLLSIGAYLSGYPKETLNLELRVTEIETVIDEIDKNLPKLKNFLLPGGGRLGATLYVVRSVARRAERSVIRFFNEQNTLGISKERRQKIIKYLNRVSDFLFVLARFANKEENITKEVWKG